MQTSSTHITNIRPATWHVMPVDGIACAVIADYGRNRKGVLTFDTVR